MLGHSVEPRRTGLHRNHDGGRNGQQLFLPRAVRDGKWKLVWDTLNRKKKWQLYDVEADRTEITDLAAQQPELVAKLTADYMTWAKPLGRHLPGEALKSGEE